MHKTHTILTTCLVIVACFSFSAQAQTEKSLPAHFNGITLDAAQELLGTSDLSCKQRQALESLTAPTIVRVVFDANTEPGEYTEALKYLRSLKLPNGDRKIFVMGELLDSDYLAQYRWECKRSEGCTFGEEGESFHDYKTRINSYLEALHEPVDIWEVGNEVNGEWADEGCVKKVNRDGTDGGCFSDVKEEEDERGNKRKSRPKRDITAKKIAYAVQQASKKNKPIALTLMHQPECTTWDKNAMFDWATQRLRPLINAYRIDYLLISYYEDNCDDGLNTTVPEERLSPEERRLPEKQKEQRRRDIYWTDTFEKLEKLFSNVQHIGFGEVGYSSDMKTCEMGDVMSFCRDGKRPVMGSKETLLNRYYGMTVKNPKYVGGHFWWTAQEDITYPAFLTKLKGYWKKS